MARCRCKAASWTSQATATRLARSKSPPARHSASGPEGSAALQTLEPASRIGGAGTVFFNGATLNIEGNYDLGDAGETHLTFGTANFISPVTSVGKTLAIDGGVADFISGVQQAVPDLDLSQGTLTGSGNLNVTEALNWTGGTMSGPGTTTAALRRDV